MTAGSPAGVGSALPISDWFYLYRTGVGDGHLSSGPADAWEHAAARAVQPGHMVRQPHWRTEYVALLREAAAASPDR